MEWLACISLFHLGSILPLYLLTAPVPLEWTYLLRMATSVLRFLNYPWRFFMNVCSSMLFASLVERWLVYSVTFSVRMLFYVVRLLTTAQPSAMACARLENNMDISMELFDVTLLYPPWREVYCRSHSPAYALMKCAWNWVQVFFGSNLARQVLQSYWNCPVSATRL